jgi:hypothetical protein
MELASYLAGERWSDHPACTHALLATLARLVNDHTSDAGRGDLVPLVPSVIGLTTDDPHVDVQIALRSATTALPVVAAERQRVLAVSVLTAERTLDELDGRPEGSLQEESRSALAHVPHAMDWAQRFTRTMRTTRRGFIRYGASSTVQHAVVGIAHACVPDPDTILRDLLAGTIDDVARRLGRDTDGVVAPGTGTATEAASASPRASTRVGRQSADERRSDDLSEGIAG